MANYVGAITELLTPLLTERGYQLYEVNQRQEGDLLVVEILVDHEELISLEEIIALTEAISPALDKADIIPHAYTLDVGSAGAEKKINPAQLEKYLGHYVRLEIAPPINELTLIEGEIVEVTSGQVTLATFIKGRPKKYLLDRSTIIHAQLAIKF